MYYRIKYKTKYITDVSAFGFDGFETEYNIANAWLFTSEALRTFVKHRFLIAKKDFTDYKIEAVDISAKKTTISFDKLKSEYRKEQIAILLKDI